MNFHKIEAGQYKSEDARFLIKNTYHSRCPWIVQDEKNSESFDTDRYETLTEAKAAIVFLCQVEVKHQQLLDIGYIFVPNEKLPGLCWKSPFSNQLFTRDVALDELAANQYLQSLA
jgi:hypothetical protein